MKKEEKKKTKSSKKSKIIKSIIAVFFFIISTILVIFINKLNIVPAKYIILGIIVLLLLNTLANFLLFRKKVLPKVFAVILYIIILLITGLGIYVSTVADNFLDKAFNNVIETYSLKFLIISPNEHEEKDLENQDIYYLNNSKYASKAIDILNDKYTTNMISSDSASAIVQNEFFMVDESTYQILIDNETIKEEDYHIIYTITVEEKVETKQTTESKDKHYYNIYVGATDFSGIRMDLNKIVTINTETNEILITNIHRFAYLEVPAYNNQKNTLDNMSYYGINNNIESLEQLFDIDIDYYIIAKSNSIVTLVDDIGGITYCSDTEFTTVHGKVLWTYDDTGTEKVHINKGCQRLDGISTLTVAREREAFYWGATERDKNTTAIMLDILDEMKKPSNITRYPEVLNDMSGLYNTSIPRDVITKYAKALLNEKWTIKTAAVSCKNSMGSIGFGSETGAVLYPKQASVNEIKEKIKALDK